MNTGISEQIYIHIYRYMYIYMTTTYACFKLCMYYIQERGKKKKKEEKQALR